MDAAGLYRNSKQRGFKMTTAQTQKTQPMTQPMKRTMLPTLAWIALVIFSAGCSGLSKVDVGRVLTSGRDGWQYPERVIEALEIEAGDHVAEIGAGSGYWLPWLSEAVGREGRVYAVEVESELVADLESFVERAGLRNVEVILGAYDDPRLPDASIDLAITVLTYHHIEDRVDYFDRLLQDLKPGGRVAHLDDRPDAPPPISWFMGEGHWSEPTLVFEEMKDAGYQKVSEFDFLPVQSFQIFEPAPHTELGQSTHMPETNASPASHVGS
jgi:arsenite methyltransferase